MPDRISSSIILYGGALALLALWILTSLTVSWDSRQRNLGESERKAWLAIAIFFPLFGFALYLASRVFWRYLSTKSQSSLNEEHARRTAVKNSFTSLPVISDHPARNYPENNLFSEQEGEAYQRMNGKVPRPDASLQPISSPGQYRTLTGLFILSVVQGPYLGQQFVLNAFPVFIGRGQDVSIPLDGDLNVSRKHAEIYEAGGVLYIRDLQSTHGTLVNERIVSERALNRGDRIQVGQTILILHEMEHNGDA